MGEEGTGEEEREGRGGKGRLPPQLKTPSAAYDLQSVEDIIS